MTDANIHGLEVGVQLWRVPDSFARAKVSPGSYVTVTKIGREWATLSNGERANLRTLAVDGRGYSSPAQLYPSEDQYEQTLAINKQWTFLASRISPVCRPDFIDEAALTALAKILRVTLPTQEQPS